MNFTFTWILDKFGFQAKPNEVDFFDVPRKPTVKKPVAKKATKVAAKKTVRKPTKK
jgi:hypothetical protein